MQTLTALVFDNFETLGLYGVIEIFGRLPEHYRIQFASLSGGVIHNQHNITLTTTAIDNLEYPTDILLVIGGQGTRQL